MSQELKTNYLMDVGQETLHLIRILLRNKNCRNESVRRQVMITVQIPSCIIHGSFADQVGLLGDDCRRTGI